MSRDKDRNVNKPLKFRQAGDWPVCAVVCCGGGSHSRNYRAFYPSDFEASASGESFDSFLNLKENTAPPNAEMQQLLARMDGMQMEIDILKETINVLKKDPGINTESGTQDHGRRRACRSG